MPKASRRHAAYRALLRLYPKAHRKEYGEQMVQTFDDLLQEDPSTQHTLGVWLRVGRELPFNIVEEHISNWEGKKMSNLKTNKRVLIVIGAALVVLVGGAIGLALLRHNDQFNATTLADIQKPANKPACLQTTADSQAVVNEQNTEFIGNAAASSIIDVPAGTNVDVFFKTYTDAKATGSAVYSGSYGNYNFVAEKKVAKDDGYTGGWRITSFAACKSR